MASFGIGSNKQSINCSSSSSSSLPWKGDHQEEKKKVYDDDGHGHGWGDGDEDDDEEDQLTIPFVIYKCIREIEKKGFDSKGIYRVSGVKSKVEKLCSRFENESEKMDLNEVNANVIANVLKLYLRELPEPLLTFKLYSRFIEIAKQYPSSIIKLNTNDEQDDCNDGGDEEEEDGKDNCSSKDYQAHLPQSSIHSIQQSTSSQSSFSPSPVPSANEAKQVINELKDIVDKMPKIHRITTAYLMHHLKRIADYHHLNNMPASNLGIVFGPTLLRTNEGTSLSSLVDTVHQTRVIQLLIMYSHQIFGPPFEVGKYGQVSNVRKLITTSWQERKSISSRLEIGSHSKQDGDLIFKRTIKHEEEQQEEMSSKSLSEVSVKRGGKCVDFSRMSLASESHLKIDGNSNVKTELNQQTSNAQTTTSSSSSNTRNIGNLVTVSSILGQPMLSTSTSLNIPSITSTKLTKEELRRQFFNPILAVAAAASSITPEYNLSKSSTKIDLTKYEKNPSLQPQQPLSTSLATSRYQQHRQRYQSQAVATTKLRKASSASSLSSYKSTTASPSNQYDDYRQKSIYKMANNPADNQYKSYLRSPPLSMAATSFSNHYSLSPSRISSPSVKKQFTDPKFCVKENESERDLEYV